VNCVEEEKVKFDTGGLFYNPHMHFCRSFSSLLVGTIPEELSLLDGFSASGIRGIRYASENPNIKSLSFVDLDEAAVELSKANAKANRIEAEGTQGEFNSFLNDKRFDFIEIDPFGSPAPYLYHAFRTFRRTRGGYISFTATDTAVLCGAHPDACRRVYHSEPLHDELFHEVGIRILLKFASQVANEFNFGVKPLATLSHRHFFKLFLKLEKGSAAALTDVANTGYITLCKGCGYRQAGEVALEICPKCGKKTSWGGPAWLGELHDAETLKKMQELNSQRDYLHKEKLAKTLSLMQGEVGMPPWFYEIHKTCGRLNIQPPPKTEILLKNLTDAGFKASQTHFSPIGIKTDADICSFGKALKG